MPASGLPARPIATPSPALPARAPARRVGSRFGHRRCHETPSSPFLLGVSALAVEPFIPSVPNKQPEPPFPPTPPEAGITMLGPGFTVRELPVKLTHLNNVEDAPDGRLLAGGCDGRFHVLRDTNGDGLKDKVNTSAPATNENYPLGMAVKDGAPTRC